MLRTDSWSMSSHPVHNLPGSLAVSLKHVDWGEELGIPKQYHLKSS